MEKGNDQTERLEWRVNMADGSSKILVAESRLVHRVWRALKDLIIGFILRICKFLQNAWKLAASEPKKVIHCIKVGVALSAVSLLYYVRPLYDGFGGNALWAIMTVIIVFEPNVGATLSKCINRVTATFLAGSLGIGVHWVAHQSGKSLEPIIIEFSLFLFASAATFSRFIPSVKARFDYGAMIFILTFSLVSVSGYRIDKLFELAHQRLTTIAIGTSLCIFVSILFWPIWAGDQLHLMIHCNLDKLAHSLKGCTVEYFKDNNNGKESEEDSSKKAQDYKRVLNSKASEESLANFARWEPTHGRFNFRHPWKQYLNIGTSVRNCAYCIEILNSCISSDAQAPEYLKKHLSESCKGLSSHSSNIMKELAVTVRTMKKSSKLDFLTGEMNLAVLDLKNALNSLPDLLTASSMPAADNFSNRKEDIMTQTTSFEDVLTLATFVSMLIEAAARIEQIVNEIDKLASLAEFKPATENKPKQKHPTEKKDHETMKSLEEV